MPKPTLTEEQGRMSAVNVQLPFGRVLPPLDSDVDPFDRQQLAYSYTSQSVLTIYVEPHRYTYWNGGPRQKQSDLRYIPIVDGVPQPSESAPGFALMFIDESDGDLKIMYEDGTVKTIVGDV